MKILNRLLCKFLGKRHVEILADKSNVVAFYSICLTKDNDLVISGDFKEGSESDMAKLIFMLTSGSLTSFIIQVIEDKCGKDSKLTYEILEEVYELMDKHLGSQDTDTDTDDEDDDDPVVDPCDVFRTQKLEEEEDD